MKISVISNSLVNVIILLLCIESCCFFKIDRELRDTSDSWDINNCNSIRRTFLENGRCRCSFSQGSSILSTNTGQIGCTMNSHIDSGKNTWYFSINCCSFLKIRDNDATFILVHDGSFMIEHIILPFSFYAKALRLKLD